MYARVRTTQPAPVWTRRSPAMRFRHGLLCRVVRPQWGRVVTAGTVFALLAAAGGCSTVAAAGGSNGNQEFVDDIAAQLSGASTQAYTAVYALRGGATGTVAQEPATERSSYTYPDGVTLVT